jgi:nucleoside-diphosphate-sugar epimerase
MEQSDRGGDERRRVLITGASGLIGSILRQRLGDKYRFSGVNRRPVPEIPCVQADIADLEAIRPAFAGIDTVVHMAAYTGSEADPLAVDWELNLSQSVTGTRNVYEAARDAGVRRVVFASSGCVILGFERDFPYSALVAGEYDRVPPQWPMADQTWPIRPDGIYGACKAFGEILGRYYSDAYGLSVLCIRLGAVLDTDRPKLRRQYPGYLSHADVTQMVERCIEAPDSLKYDVFDAVSDNRWAWRSTQHAREVLGYEPRDSADVYTLDG